jgi:hypothetical protein
MPYVMESAVTLQKSDFRVRAFGMVFTHQQYKRQSRQTPSVRLRCVGDRVSETRSVIFKQKRRFEAYIPVSVSAARQRLKAGAAR